MIGVDRPGYGLSGAQPGRRLLDWPADVVRLADFLDIETFRVLGVSGGGPFAAACAWRTPQRLKSVGIVAGLGPLHLRSALDAMCRFNRFGLALAADCPSLLRPILAAIRWLLRRRPDRALQFVVHRAGAPDAEFLHKPEMVAVMRDSFRESMRFGIQGAADDLHIYSRPWGFPLDAVSVRVFLWHGEKDRLVPAAMGRHLAASIPDCRARFFADEGHFSLVVRRMDAILASLAAQ